MRACSPQLRAANSVLIFDPLTSVTPRDDLQLPLQVYGVVYQIDSVQLDP